MSNLIVKHSLNTSKAVISRTSWLQRHKKDDNATADTRWTLCFHLYFWGGLGESHDWHTCCST